jgi:Zn-finger nucleic acid-binding protein
MNCINCNAPLTEKSDRCEFCGTLNDTDLRRFYKATISEEGPSEKTCPRCNIPLSTVRLKFIGELYLERCEKCLGLFFDPGELESLLKSDSRENEVEDFQHLDVLLADHERKENWPTYYVHCPVCTELMNRRAYGVRSGVIIDSCKKHGIWLDGGELGRLIRWERSGGMKKTEEYEEEKARDEAKKARIEREPGFSLTGFDTSQNCDRTESGIELFVSLISDIARFFNR